MEKSSCLSGVHLSCLRLIMGYAQIPPSGNPHWNDEWLALAMGDRSVHACRVPISDCNVRYFRAAGLAHVARSGTVVELTGKSD